MPMGQCQCTSMEDHGQWIVSHGMGLVMFMMSHSPKLHVHGPVPVYVYGRPWAMDRVLCDGFGNAPDDLCPKVTCSMYPDNKPMGHSQCTCKEDHGEWILYHGMDLVLLMMYPSLM